MNQNKVCWKDLLIKAMGYNDESLDDVVANTMSEEEMLVLFNKGCGGINDSFTVWTDKSVYFPVCDDMAEWVERVARNPDGKPTEHCGG